MGLNLNTLLQLDLPRRREFGWTFALRPDIGAQVNGTYWGIPVSSFSGEGQMRVILAFGKKTTFPSRPDLAPSLRAHTLSYYLSAYATTDRTSQLSGGISYSATWGAGAIDFIFENDLIAFLGRDEYRTAAVALRYRLNYREHLLGIGATILLWTGTTTGLESLDRGEFYDMSGQYGANYSHGLLSLDLLYDSWRLSIGYDSDSIRTAVQGAIHDLINQGRIPAVDRADRFFIQLGLLDLRNLY